MITDKDQVYTIYINLQIYMIKVNEITFFLIFFNQLAHVYEADISNYLRQFD